ncbi:hypothetical protein VTN02DRAFT_2807 [Thermoascus thermophilus]
MAGPSNPFTGPAAGQKKDGAGNAAGRARSSHGRPTPYQSKKAGSQRESKSRGRVRGVGSAARSERRSDTSTTSTESHAVPEKAETATGTPAASSPFAQLKQNNAVFSSTFGKPSGAAQPGTSSPFAGLTAGSSTFGAPSNMAGAFGSSVDRGRDPRRRPTARPAGKTQKTGVPVEDAKVMSSYHDRYEKLKLDRAKQRERAIKEGQMADPNQPTSLNQAITPVGTCTSMCPEFERVERIVQKMVDKSEKFLHPATNKYQNMETKMLKRFRRSAAGYDEQLPSDIRTPKTLLQTLNYLIRHVIGGAEPLGVIHKFVWDRTRSIRNDLSIQQLTQEDHVRMAVTCLERIARFHIVSLHLLSSPANQEPFDHHQEREQLNNTLLSLMYYYDDNRGRIAFPNEDEFRAYYIVFSIHDQRPDLEARVQKWPAELRQSPRVQVALELFAAAGNTWEYQGTLDAKRPNAIAQGFYTRFFSLVDSPSVSYLLACVAEIYFNHVRHTAIRSIWKGYCRQPLSQQHKNEEWTLEELTDALYFDNTEQTRDFCEEQDLEFAENSEGQLYLNWGNRAVDSVDFQPSSQHAFSEKYVESKRAGRTLVAIILGLNIKQAASQGMIDTSLLPSRVDTLQPAAVAETAEENESLFVSEDENETPAPKVQVNGHTPELDGFEKPSTFASPFGNAFQGHSRTATGESSSNLEINKPAGPFAQPVPQPAESKRTFSSMFGASQTQGPAATSAIPPGPFRFSAPATFTQQNSAPSQTQNTLFSAQPNAQPTSSIFSAKPGFLTKPPTAHFPPATSAQPFSFTPAVSNAPVTGPSPAPAGGRPASVFDSLKAAQAPSSSIFNFSNQTPSIGEPKPASGPNLFSQPVQEPGTFHQKPPSLFPPKTEATVSSAPGGGIFAPPTSSVPTVDGNQENKLAKAQPTPAVPSEPAAITPPTAASTQEKHVSITSAEKTPPQPSEAAQAGPVAATRAEPLAMLTSPVEPSISKEPVDGESLPGKEFFDSGANERRLAWIEVLRETANRRRQEFIASRKRALEEAEEQPPVEETSRAAKMSKAEEAPSGRRSIALASIKPLPTLPILEQVKATTERKPAPKPEEPKGPVIPRIDEDELLLSAARIAAESLRTGPSLLESFHDYPEPRPDSRSRFSRSLSSVSDLSRSQSPSSQARVNGYDVALAPDTPLGLGRTMSRTEQRIRLTGGKGLAFKPLNLTPPRNAPKKEMKEKKEKKEKKEEKEKK